MSDGRQGTYYIRIRVSGMRTPLFLEMIHIIYHMISNKYISCGAFGYFPDIMVCPNITCVPIVTL